MTHSFYYLRLARGGTWESPEGGPVTYQAGDLVPCRYLAKPPRHSTWSYWNNSDADVSHIFAPEDVSSIYVETGSPWVGFLEGAPTPCEVVTSLDEWNRLYSQQYERRNREWWSHPMRANSPMNPYRAK